MESGQFEHAVRQIESNGEELVARGRTQTLLRWVEALPLDHSNRPWFLFYRAVACRFSDPRTALTFFELAHRGFRTHKSAFRRTSGLLYSVCGIIESCFHSGGDFIRMERTAGFAQKLLKQEQRVPPGLRARLLLTMGMAWFFMGKLPQGAAALARALELFRKQGDHFYQVTCVIYLTPCALYQGEFRIARAALAKGFEAIAALPDAADNRAALYLTKAMASLFEGDFNSAQESIDHCQGLVDTHALESIGFLSLDIAGWLKIAQGEYRAAEVLLAECKRKGEASQNAFFCASASHLLAIAYMFQQKYDLAIMESNLALAIRTQSQSRLFRAIYMIASGAIKLKLGQPGKA